MKQFSWVKGTRGTIRAGGTAAPTNFSLNPGMTRYALSFIFLTLPEAPSSGWTLEINLRGCSAMPWRIHFIGQPAGMCCSDHQDECDRQISARILVGFFPAFPWIIWGYLTFSVCYKHRSCEGWWYLSLSCALFLHVTVNLYRI